MNTKDVDYFLKKAREVHGDRYDYSKVVYIGAAMKVIIGCPVHGDFEQPPMRHYNNGCNKCARAERNRDKVISHDEVIRRSNEKYGNQYDYRLMTYKSTKDKISVICPQHGEWSVRLKDHLYGKYGGCPTCGRKRISEARAFTTDDFVVKSREIHGAKYDYSQVNFSGMRNHVTIVCGTHGPFEIIPNLHIHFQRGCRNCDGKFSMQSDWLDAMGIPRTGQHRQVRLELNDGFIYADGWDGKNTVYEFWGTYYHGHPDYYASDDTSFFGPTFGELYEKTISKIDHIKSSGYDLVQIWEHEWKPERFSNRKLK